MTVNGSKEKRMVRVSLSMQVVMCTRVSGSKIKLKVMARTRMPMAVPTLVIGTKINNTERAKSPGRMVLSMRVIT